MLRGALWSAEIGPRALRTAAVVIVALWCVVAAVQFGRVMRGPTGLVVSRPPGSEGAVGMPLPGAEVVTALREMLKGDGGSHAWLLVLPGDTPPFVMTYIRYQLSHIAYPRRVVVTTPEKVGPLDGFVAVVAPPGIVPRGDWRAVERRNGLTRYERARS